MIFFMGTQVRMFVYSAFFSSLLPIAFVWGVFWRKKMPSVSELHRMSLWGMSMEGQGQHPSGGVSIQQANETSKHFLTDDQKFHVDIKSYVPRGIKMELLVFVNVFATCVHHWTNTDGQFTKRQWRHGFVCFVEMSIFNTFFVCVYSYSTVAFWFFLSHSNFLLFVL